MFPRISRSCGPLLVVVALIVLLSTVLSPGVTVPVTVDPAPRPTPTGQMNTPFRFGPVVERVRAVVDAETDTPMGSKSPESTITTPNRHQTTHRPRHPIVHIWSKAAIGESTKTAPDTDRHQTTHRPRHPIVHIWSKAAVGEYLWYHVLEGKTTARKNNLWKEGNITVGRGGDDRASSPSPSAAQLWFRSGWDVQQGSAPQLEPQHLVLVLNGHEPKLARTAETWLNLIPTIPSLEGVVVLLHGSETCRNDWFRPYLQSSKYKIRGAFVTYATDLIDNVTVFQWPLGVATYRGFPLPSALPTVPTTNITHLCNFFATMYGNSSREDLLSALGTAPELAAECVLRPREKWLPKETTETRTQYISALQTSTFTLSPAGLNTECYRWLEAAAFGSTPIIEDVRKPTECGDPLALLREFDAPFEYVTNWTTDTVALLQRLQREPPSTAAARRIKTVAWYRHFRTRLKERFTSVIFDILLADRHDVHVAVGVRDVRD